MRPIYMELDIGEEVQSTFESGKMHRVKLLSVQTYTEPLYQKGRWFDVFLKAEVVLLLDEERCTLCCAPYQLPVVIGDLRVEVDLVEACAGGPYPAKLKKAVRIAVLDAQKPWMDELYRLPMEDYRWRASNYMHTWNGFVHVVESKDNAEVYYHRGEDFGALPDRHALLSASEGICTIWPPVKGDGDSNLIAIQGNSFGLCYYHVNINSLSPEIQAGMKIQPGDKLALTGETWHNHSVDDPHLHMGLCFNTSDVDDTINGYAAYVNAYRRNYPDEILPIAGGYRFTKVHEPIELTAEKTIGAGKPLSFEWALTDDTRHAGEKVQCCYAKAGVYTELLKVCDSEGRTAFDSVMVYVSDGVCSQLPFAAINTWPVRGIKAGTPVELLIYPCRMHDVTIDFGDGEKLVTNDVRVHIYHTWRVPGDYVITVRGDGDGACGIFKTIVRVEPAEEM